MQYQPPWLKPDPVAGAVFPPQFPPDHSTMQYAPPWEQPVQQSNGKEPRTVVRNTRLNMLRAKEGIPPPPTDAKVARPPTNTKVARQVELPDAGDIQPSFHRIAFVNPAGYEPGETIELPLDIASAIKCADLSAVNIRNWRLLPDAELTVAESAMRMLEAIVKVPSGRLVGKPLRFMFFQEVILYFLLDQRPDTFVLSVARRNGKSFILSCIALIYLISSLADRNSEIASAAMSRDQAALIYKELENMLMLSPKLQRFLRHTPSGKKIVGLVRNVVYQALAAEAKTGYGHSYKVVILDEAGQIIGPDNDYVAMLRSSQGSVDNPLYAVISTQAPSDADYLSVLIDAATRDQTTNTVCIVFEAGPDAALDDIDAWFMANPGLGVFRSYPDMVKLSKNALAVPQTEARFRNLNLNQRIALEKLWLAPTVWKANTAESKIEVFQEGQVSLGIDLSMRTDLTAAVFAAKDEFGITHLKPLVFTPLSDIAQRELRDKAPYQMWVKQGLLIGVPGPIINYEWVAEYLRLWCEKFHVPVARIAFDRWRIDLLKNEFSKANTFMDAEWSPVGQGYKDMSPRLETFEAKLMDRKIAHGAHPLLNLAAGSAISVSDPAGNRKLDKAKATQRIDALVAAVMAVHELESKDFFDIDAMIA